jgi:membrane protease YdiL (CAAX protease family)
MSAGQLPQQWAAIHGGIFLAALVPGALWGQVLGWPLYLLLPLATYLLLVLPFPRLRPTVPWPRLGRMTGLPLLAALILSLLARGVLLAYYAWLIPDVTILAASLPVAAFGNLALAALCFSILNATLEELLFRSVLYDAVAVEWSNPVAVVVTAALFGLGHLHGYPPGPPGAILAAGYGVALGLLRWWTGGLGLAIASHICADATIFEIMASSGAFVD